MTREPPTQVGGSRLSPPSNDIAVGGTSPSWLGRRTSVFSLSVGSRVKRLEASSGRKPASLAPRLASSDAFRWRQRRLLPFDHAENPMTSEFADPRRGYRKMPLDFKRHV